MNMKQALFFGIYDPGYSRNRVLMKGFSAHSWRVLECRADPRQFPGIRKYLELYRQYRRIRHERFDLVLVAYPGQTVVPLARLLFGNRFVFDAFVSLYDSNVKDRKVHPERSIAAGLDWLADWLSTKLAPVILLDTEAHIDYFVREFGIAREKFIRVFVGTDLVPARREPDERLTVHFHGTYIPLQGIPYIIEAAELLADLPLTVRLIGRGQEYERIRAWADAKKLANVVFDEPVPNEHLADEIARATVCLGIFGDTGKASRVIPNKVYECLAAGKPVITADTPAIREAFTDRKDIYLCKAASPESLAAAIRTLAGDSALRARLGASARAVMEERFTPERIVGGLLEMLSARDSASIRP
ncbi:MAG TPA: glycosyltransferase [Candidatus Paceibacterota bacterium]|nr:glycosyltransferase [Candidatus Paceibacterota bacterium]